jgi:hypothetical protein
VLIGLGVVATCREGPALVPARRKRWPGESEGPEKARAQLDELSGVLDVSLQDLLTAMQTAFAFQAGE